MYSVVSTSSKRTYLFRYTGLLFCCLQNSVFAAELTNTQAAAISYGQIMNLIIGLIIVLLAFFCVAYVLKRIPGSGGVSRGYMKVIDALPVSTRERLLLVKVANTYLLLGVTAGSINALHVMDEEIHEESEESNLDFKAQLQKIFNQSRMKGE